MDDMTWQFFSINPSLNGDWGERGCSFGFLWGLKHVLYLLYLLKSIDNVYQQVLGL